MKNIFKIIIVTMILAYVILNICNILILAGDNIFFDDTFLKIIISAGCMFVAFLAYNRPISKVDYYIACLAFIFNFVCDVLMATNNIIPGIAAFLINHIFLIVRNFRFKKNEQFTKRSYVILFVIFVIMVIADYKFYPLFSYNIYLLLVVYIYSFVLSVSLFSAIMVWDLNLIYQKNLSMIAIGMVLFYLTDIVVAIKIGISDDYINNLLLLIIWLLYPIAIFFISISVYSYKVISKK